MGLDDALGIILWSRNFVEAQGYQIDQNIVMQDNNSTMLLAVNGRASSGKRTKHIKARYFFIKDKVDSGEAELQRCPTDRMWSDVLTKPKQGSPYRQLRAEVMNVPVDYDDDVEGRDTPVVLIFTKDELANGAGKRSIMLVKAQPKNYVRETPSKQENSVQKLTGTRAQPGARQRSVLGEIQNLPISRPKKVKFHAERGTPQTRRMTQCT